MEAKPIEVIMRIDFAASNGTEIVAHAEKVSELVRCRDCKWFDMFEPSGNISPITFQCKRVRSLWMEADAYCKYGERKEA